jgi:hypothetical protein
VVPGVASLNPIERGPVYVIVVDSEKLGAAATNVYVALAIVLAANPPPAAIALIVVVAETRIGAVYRVDEVVGVVPSNV